MSQVLKIGPVTRVEGHLEVEITIDAVGGVQKVIDAKSRGTTFRGFELMLVGRDPRDAVHYTQRVCGVCPVSHAMAASQALEGAFGVLPNANGRAMRNLILGAEFLHSHILHFYHLALADYVDFSGVLNAPTWAQEQTPADALKGDAAHPFIEHYVQALSMRRKAHQMAAIFAGKMPHGASMIAGGCLEVPTRAKISAFSGLLAEVKQFIETVFVPDAQALAAKFPAYRKIGKGCGNFLAFGVFDQDERGNAKLLQRGRFTDGQAGALDAGLIKEYVGSSYFSASSGNVTMAGGKTEVAVNKAGAYSFIKAPRYQDKVHEVGALARMWVNGDYRKGVSVMDRLMARAAETLKIAEAMPAWLKQLVPDATAFNKSILPQSGSGMGLTEAGRGALGHWVGIAGGKLSRYQILTPTAWNASPADDKGVKGALEQAMIGVEVADPAVPAEVLRVIHSFDPCLACAVHVCRPGRSAQVVLRG